VLPFAPALPLATERLRLRAFVPDDLEPLFAIRSREDVVRWLYQEPWTTREIAAEQLDSRYAATALREDGDRLFLGIELTATGELIGDCMLRLVNAENSTGEIGYVLAPAHQGHGYATETARELLRLGFEDAALHRIIARCEPRNEPSFRVMERLGMRREAHFVENEWVKGAWESELVYALLEREWRSS
jgi:RimJ/RimL family protein N-acetyltransferase